MRDKLLEYLFATKSIMVSEEGFVAKSGGRYHFETDVREAMRDSRGAAQLAEILYTLIEERVGPETLIVGVPETGTFLAFLLNAQRAKRGTKPFTINMLRAQPKPYQKETAISVLPIPAEAEILLIEDDIVTGDTLISYLNQLSTRKFKKVEVVAIIDREDSKSVQSVGERVQGMGYEYASLLTFGDIREYAVRNGHKFPEDASGLAEKNA